MLPFTVPVPCMLHGTSTVHESGCVLPPEAGSTVSFITYCGEPSAAVNRMCSLLILSIESELMTP